MSLIEKLNKELNKHNLEFKIIKEYSTKYKGILIDKNTDIKLDFEVEKCLQINYIKSFSEFCRKHIDLYSSLLK